MFRVYASNPELNPLGEYWIRQKTAYLREHFNKIEEIYRKETEDLWKLIRIEDERTKDHEDDSQYDYRAVDSLRDIEFVYLRMHRYSAILAAYTYLESSLIKLCAIAQDKWKIGVAVGDLAGDGITRCRIYLEKLGRVSFDAMNPTWSRLAILNKLRNCIMHNNGDAEKARGSKAFIEVIESTGGLSFAEEKLIMVEAQYIIDAIQDIEDFLIFLTK